MTLATSHSAEAEASTLGAILLDPGRALGRVRQLCRPADFFDPKHQLLFEAMLELDASGRPLDVVTLSDHLQRRDLLSRVGGLELLAELAGRVATVENVSYHARMVAEKSLTRQVQLALGRCASSTAEGVELLQEVHQELALIQVPEVSEGTTLRAELLSALNTVERLQGSGLLGLPTHLHDLDREMAGIPIGVKVIVAARPQQGKSSFTALVSQLHVEDGGTADYYTLEDTRTSLTLRMISQRAQVNNRRLRGGDLTTVEWQAVQQAAGKIHSFGDRMRIWDDIPRDAEMFAVHVTQNALRRRSQTAENNWRHLIVVDYVQLLRLASFSNKGDNRNAELTVISTLLKKVPKDCNCSLIVVSQLKRLSDERPPQLDDLRDCGALEADAEVVLMLDRPRWLCDADGKELPACWAHVRKNKNAGTGTVPLSWRGEFVLFGDADEELSRMCWAAQRAQRKSRGKR